MRNENERDEERRGKQSSVLAIFTYSYSDCGSVYETFGRRVPQGCIPEIKRIRNSNTFFLFRLLRQKVVADSCIITGELHSKNIRAVIASGLAVNDAKSLHVVLGGTHRIRDEQRHRLVVLLGHGSEQLEQTLERGHIPPIQVQLLETWEHLRQEPWHNLMVDHPFSSETQLGEARHANALGRWF